MTLPGCPSVPVLCAARGGITLYREPHRYVRCVRAAVGGLAVAEVLARCVLIVRVSALNGSNTSGEVPELADGHDFKKIAETPAYGTVTHLFHFTGVS